VLDFPTWQAEEPGFSMWWQALIAEFQRSHPGVQIRLSGITPSARHTDQMAIRMAAGNPPDILHLPAARAREFVKQGWLEPLDDRLKGTDILENWTPLQSFMQVSGKNYGILLLGYNHVMFYNKRLLQEAGVAVPRTADQFIRAIKATTKDTNSDGVIDQFGLTLYTDPPTSFYQQTAIWVIGAGGHYAVNGRITVDSTAVRTGLTRMTDLFRSGSIPVGLNIAQSLQLFLEGKAAFIMDGPWYWATIQRTAKPEVARNVEVAPLPFPRISGGASNSIHMPIRLSRDRANLTWEFIHLLTRPAWQRAYAEMGELPPPRLGIVTERLVRDHPQVGFFASGLDRSVNVLPAGFEDEFSKFARIVADEVFKLATVRGRTVDAAVADMQRALEAQFGRR
jgi:multiple sugar transport system substrate-binding protein